MVLHIIAVGRLTDPGLRHVCADYAGRVRRIHPVEIHEIRAPAARAVGGERRRMEGARLLAALPSGARAIALTRAGRGESSLDFARRFARWRQEGRDVAFVIGGAHGLDRRVLARCEATLSLSPLTLPHELARAVLLEQLYRACTILAGTPYHKSSDGRLRP